MDHDIFSTEIEETFTIAIHIAGDYGIAKALCKGFAWDSPTCVTINKQCFIYTGGTEDGVRIGLVNYPRFPKTEDYLLGQAMRLAKMLIKETHETTALIVTDNQTFWVHRERQDSK